MHQILMMCVMLRATVKWEYNNYRIREFLDEHRANGAWFKINWIVHIDLKNFCLYFFTEINHMRCNAWSSSYQPHLFPNIIRKCFFRNSTPLAARECIVGAYYLQRNNSASIPFNQQTACCCSWSSHYYHDCFCWWVLIVRYSYTRTRRSLQFHCLWWDGMK